MIPGNSKVSCRRRWGTALIMIPLAALAAHRSNAQAVTPTNAPSIDMTAPAFAAIAQAHAVDLAAADSTRVDKLRKILERYLADADDMLKEKKKTRNLTGIAVATTARYTFETALTNLSKEGKFALPADARRELQETIDNCKREVDAVEKTFAEAKSKAFTDHFNKFIAEVSAVRPGSPDPQWLESTFRQLITTPIAAPSPTMKVTNQGPAPGGSGTNTTVAAPESLPEFFAVSAEASNATWLTVGRWIGTMRGLDVISIPLAQMRIGTNKTEQLNPITGRMSQLQYISLTALPSTVALNFRLKRIPEHVAVQVMEWPSERNRQTLMIRTTASDRFPCIHGFDLQVSVPTGDVSKIIAAAATAAATVSNAPPPVILSLSTTPQGASIIVDGKAIESVVTPCKLRLSQSIHALTMTLPGFAEYRSQSLQTTSNLTVNWFFKPDPRFARATIPVAAAAERWTSASISALKGDLICVYAEGKWACASGGAKCDPSGYPKNDQNMNLYADPTQSPRLVQETEYGALLMRIGDSPSILTVGSSARIAAPAQGGIFFDINEVQDKRLRKDNTGQLSVTVIVIPKALAPR